MWEPSRRRLTWPNGAIATTYSADVPDQLRGPFKAAMSEEKGLSTHVVYAPADLAKFIAPKGSIAVPCPSARYIPSRTWWKVRDAGSST